MTVHLRDLTRGFAERVVLDIAGLDLAPGEFVALIGLSGSAKSTLLRAIAGLDDDAAGGGTVIVSDSRSVLFQDSRLLPRESVLRNARSLVRQPALLLADEPFDALTRLRMYELLFRLVERHRPTVLMGYARC